jgi:hypothetical protein
LIRWFHHKRQYIASILGYLVDRIRAESKAEDIESTETGSEAEYTQATEEETKSEE